MRQFSIKNEQAVELLEQITRLTGEGKTEAVVHALELYQANLMRKQGTEAVLETIRTAVHRHVPDAMKGRAPGKSEIEAELDLP